MTTTLSKAIKAGVIGYDEARCALNIAWHGGSCPPMSDANRASIAPMIAEAIKRALPMIMTEVAEAAWLQSKQGGTHDQIAAAVHAKLAEIMETK